MNEMTKDDLLNQPHYGLQIMKDGSICIDDVKIPGHTFAACGQDEEPRNYATSWYEGELAVHIYLSETLEGQKDEMLQLLGIKLFFCKTVDDLMGLNGQRLIGEKYE